MFTNANQNEMKSNPNQKPICYVLYDKYEFLLIYPSYEPETESKIDILERALDCKANILAVQNINPQKLLEIVNEFNEKKISTSAPNYLQSKNISHSILFEYSNRNIMDSNTISLQIEKQLLNNSTQIEMQKDLKKYSNFFPGKWDF